MRTAITGRSPQPGFGLGAAAAEEDLGEALCRVQAQMLDMGEDNYRRLCRLCPDADERYRVLQRRVTHQVRAALASSQPPWRRRTHAPAASAAVLPAGRDVQVMLDWQQRTPDAGGGAGSRDWFAPGRPVDAEICWRCDARDAAGEVGLCQPCHAALAAR